jgi:hypothetical protein
MMDAPMNSEVLFRAVLNVTVAIGEAEPGATGEEGAEVTGDDEVEVAAGMIAVVQPEKTPKEMRPADWKIRRVKEDNILANKAARGWPEWI